MGHISGIQMVFDLIEDERNICERVATQVRSADLSILMMNVMREVREPRKMGRVIPAENRSIGKELVGIQEFFFSANQSNL